MKTFFILRLSWRNIWRNKVRSGVILGAIAIGLLAGTYLSALMSGWVLGTVNSDINNFMSHVQIHDTAFVANSDINAVFQKTTVQERIARSGIEATLACRLKMNGMLASANNAIGIAVKGIDRDEEMKTTTLYRQIPDSLGAFFPDDARLPIFISGKTADKLKVRVKSKIIFTFQDSRGDMQSLAFRVCGIFKTTNGMFDESTAFVRYADIFPTTGLPDGAAHEAAVLFSGLEASDALTPKIRELFPDMKVDDWTEMSPTLAMNMAFMDMMTLIFTGIFLFALSFGIVNTMLMAVLERSRELDMLGAIGMSRRKVFSMIMFETLLLTFIGSIAGIILALAFLAPSVHSGLDLTPLMGEDFVDWGFGSVIYPVVNIKMFLQTIALVFAAGILSAVYPAKKALGDRRKALGNRRKALGDRRKALVGSV
ncbi:MAG: FtsX-like permease family protein [Prevotellaceae bacterium]|jgi:ABC-type lipoprotein release transport system permease subunit|nr:FtsX-like permease family protein [Prevotellaceae bacterium]